MFFFFYFRWYIGIRSEPDDHKSSYYKQIINGKGEAVPGLTNITVIYKKNHLSTLSAWNLEFLILQIMLSTYASKTMNRTLKFGLGPLPKKSIDEQLYTITLIRGVINHQSYRAYENDLPNDLPSLTSLIEKGKHAKEEITNYVDKLISTWSLQSADLGQYTFSADDIHPCSLNPTEAIETDPDNYHSHLVNKCQRHKHTNECLRVDKKTKLTYCRFDFPKKHQYMTKIVVLPYSRNKENGDIYYKVDILSKRNDAWLNEFNRAILDNWQVCVFQYIATYYISFT